MKMSHCRKKNRIRWRNTCRHMAISSAPLHAQVKINNHNPLPSKHAHPNKTHQQTFPFVSIENGFGVHKLYGNDTLFSVGLAASLNDYRRP